MLFIFNSLTSHISYIKIKTKFMKNERPFDIKNYDIIVSCPGGASDRCGLARIKEGALSVIDNISSTGIAVSGNELYRIIYHKPYAVSKILELAVYEDMAEYRHRPGEEFQPPPLSLVYHDIIDPHDILIHEGLIFIVSSGTNEIVCLDEKSRRISERIKFEGNGNAWHLNCLSLINGEICVSAFMECAEDYGWKKIPTKERGFIMNLKTKEKIWDGLSMPHNPIQWDDGTLSVCNSQTNSVIFRYPDGKTKEAFFGGFTRGMRTDGRYAFIGVSPDRSKDGKAGNKNASLAVYDAFKDSVEFEIEVPFSEIYDIYLVKENRFPYIAPLGDIFADKDEAINTLKSAMPGLLSKVQQPLEASGLNLKINIEEKPAELKSGGIAELTVKIENYGDTPMQSAEPNPVHLSYHWKKAESSEYEIFDGIRTPLNVPLFPESYLRTKMKVQAPLEAGRYVLEISLVQEWRFWFEEHCPSLPETTEIIIG